jgi:hypothetical protein
LSKIFELAEEISTLQETISAEAQNDRAATQILVSGKIIADASDRQIDLLEALAATSSGNEDEAWAKVALFEVIESAGLLMTKTDVRLEIYERVIASAAADFIALRKQNPEREATRRKERLKIEAERGRITWEQAMQASRPKGFFARLLGSGS